MFSWASLEKTVSQTLTVIDVLTVLRGRLQYFVYYSLMYCLLSFLIRVELQSLGRRPQGCIITSTTPQHKEHATHDITADVDHSVKKGLGASSFGKTLFYSISILAGRKSPHTAHTLRAGRLCSFCLGVEYLLII